ncbi:PSD1 and planctomycete cytochrome C domain-containing protein [Tundrisphaera sp. TA3]|uniref:PSD1 and planctomycete cytochrome C domain-containing protein n=1 Tax=Tundrisphaera sp. TA3 TaxID=3435775 RepID=UPI003EBEFB08
MLVVSLMLLGLPADAGRAVDYASEIRPVLAAACLKCHGPDKQEGDLRLDLKVRALEGGLSGEAIVPGKVAESPILAHLEGRDGKKAMPPKGPRLPDEQIGLIRLWIEQGAAWPDDPATAEPGSTHWAYQKPVRPEPPAVADPSWVRNPIDAFVAKRLEAEGLAPSPEADRARLIRRVSLDLTGLPPTVEEVDAFIADTNPDAYEKVVDRLLASPHFGERWARPWLDLARYADTHGYEKDPIRTMWPYRDWVINALNRDMPFDQFTVEQLAGDLLPGATLAQKIASGFHRNTMVNTEGGVDPEEARDAVLVDRVGTTATAWMGTTLACAQCHAHKFDPFPQKDFYRFYAFFNSAEEPTIDLGTPAEIARRDAIRAQVAALRQELKEYRKGEAGRIKAWEAALTPEARSALKPEARAALDTPAADRDEARTKAIAAAYRESDEGLTQRQAVVAELAKREPSFPQAMVMQEAAKPRETRLHVRGSFRSPGDVVAPGVPEILPAMAEGEPTNRLGLARWLTRPDHPLTARVAVNRIWEQYWGRGLVGTVEDFGTQGEPPTHPELLDWLATELPRQGWSLKAIHRLIVTSAAYRQSSKASAERIARDPDNRLLGRGPRGRVDAEGVRDIALAASGLLSHKVGGPSVFPPQPEGVWTMIYSSDRWVTSTGEDRYRRGLYTFWRRTAPYPTFMAFDAPSREASCARRPRSNTPIQALATLNDPAFVEAARALARRVVAEGGDDPRSRAARGFRLCVARMPDAAEVDRIVALYEGERDHYRADADAALAMAAGAPDEPAASKPDPAQAPELAAWTVVANVLLNLDETISKE